MRQRPLHRVDRWPVAPELAGRVLMDQVWSDVVFLHWRIPVSVAAPFMPPGVRPDVFDGSSWVGLIGFRMSSVRLGVSPPVPYFGSFTEVNVRLYSREQDGTRGVVFRSLDASRLAVVLAARAGGVPYVWSRCHRTVTRGPAPSYRYDVDRFRGQPGSSFAVRPHRGESAEDELSLELTARFGLHSRFAGRTVHTPIRHAPWLLQPATVIRLEDGLLAEAGVGVEGPPESVLYSTGTRTRFGTPRVVQAA